ncbi:MAG: TraB/GumN family protein [Clostridia bacterium]|nr:TraB/GumN family protein [Clostridia bacterium]
MKRYYYLGIILALVLMMISCQNNEAAATDSIEAEHIMNEAIELKDEDPFKGYFWEISDDDNTVYLYGSIHMAKEDLYPLSDDVMSAYDSSDYLVVEADVSNVDPVKYAAAVVYETGTIYDHLSPRGIEKYETICDEMHINPELYQNLKVWVAGSTLMQFQLMRSDYSAGYGIDMYFLNDANKTKKEILALEGMDYQLNLLNNFSDEIQESLFFDSLGTIDETIADFETLYTLFTLEDEKALEAYLIEEDSDLTADPEIEKVMLTDRNLNMANKINEFMADDKDYFVVVGVAHYLGADSVIAYLESMGYTVNKR